MSAIFKVTTIVPVIERPHCNTYILDQAELRDFSPTCSSAPSARSRSRRSRANSPAKVKLQRGAGAG
jgi:hypothetical protein